MENFFEFATTIEKIFLLKFLQKRKEEILVSITCKPQTINHLNKQGKDTDTLFKENNLTFPAYIKKVSNDTIQVHNHETDVYIDIPLDFIVDIQ